MRLRKRLIRVEVLLKHGGKDYGGKDYPDIREVIELNRGQSFHQGFGYDSTKENGVKVKAYHWKAGYTVEYTFLYAEREERRKMQIGRLVLIPKKSVSTFTIFKATEFHIIDLAFFPWMIVWISKRGKKFPPAACGEG